eukprot:Nk52_evm7s245 gene=Nk52_evmTU7s245
MSSAEGAEDSPAKRVKLDTAVGGTNTGGGIMRLPAWRDLGRDQKRVFFARPELIGAFSKTEEGFTPRSRSHRPLRYKEAPLGTDLTIGHEHFVEKESEADLSCITGTLKSRGFDFKRNKVQFVSYRNNFNKIMSTVYSRKNEWKIGVYRDKEGIIYLDVVKMEDKNNDTERPEMKRFNYIGRRFEVVSCEKEQAGEGSSAPLSPEKEAKTVEMHAKSEACIILRLTLGKHVIVMGAEIDCYEDGPNARSHSAEGTNGSSMRLVELKTSRSITNERQNRSFARYKLMKFWIQSFLAGVPKIVCGFHDDGLLVKNSSFDTLSIPSMCRGLWDANECLDFTNCFLSLLQREVKEDVYYIAEYSANDQVILRPVSGEGFPEWFPGVVERETSKRVQPQSHQASKSA